MSALFLGILRGVLRSKQALDVERLQEAVTGHGYLCADRQRLSPAVIQRVMG